jgi:C-terminal processing protease CtpA/Prc
VSFLLAALSIAALLLLTASGGQSQKSARVTTQVQSNVQRLDADTRNQVLADVAETIRDQYADRKVGEALADTILADLEKGRFDSVADVDGLVAEIMAVIRAKVPDRHFELRLRGESDEDDDASPPRERSRHGLRTLRMLENDTAYLEFDNLPGDSASLSIVEEQLAELPEVQALILDIRDNNGGSGDMVVLLCNHLLEEGKLLYKYQDRSDRPPGEMRASSHPRHFGPDVPVLILTSDDTMSAAEALAYILQDYDRATVVGEQTAGMANPSRTFSIGDRFELTVPFLLIHYGKNGTTFAGPGVVPDIAAPADSALDVALAEIGSKLASPER